LAYCHLGERSPLGWLYAADAAILLLGVGYDACTAFHLAEYRRPSTRPQKYHCFVADGGDGLSVRSPESSRYHFKPSRFYAYDGASIVGGGGGVRCTTAATGPMNYCML
jgi:aminoglycoside N3'-acetyltransferase